MPKSEMPQPGTYMVRSCTYRPYDGHCVAEMKVVGNAVVNGTGGVILSGFAIDCDSLRNDPSGDGERFLRNGVESPNDLWRLDEVHECWPHQKTIYLRRGLHSMSLHGLQLNE